MYLALVRWNLAADDWAGGASLVAFQMRPVGRRISVWNGQLALSFLPEVGAIAASSLATLTSSTDSLAGSKIP